MPGIACVSVDIAGGVQLGAQAAKFKIRGNAAEVLGDRVAGHPPATPNVAAGRFSEFGLFPALYWLNPADLRGGSLELLDGSVQRSLARFAAGLRPRHPLFPIRSRACPHRQNVPLHAGCKESGV